MHSMHTLFNTFTHSPRSHYSGPSSKNQSGEYLIRAFFTSKSMKSLRAPVFPSVEKERARERKSSSTWICLTRAPWHCKRCNHPPICCQLATLRHPKTRPSLLRFLYYLLNTVFKDSNSARYLYTFAYLWLTLCLCFFSCTVSFILLNFIDFSCFLAIDFDL